MYFVAGGKRINTERTGRFSEQMDSIYENPFAGKQTQMTGVTEIKDYIRGKIRALRKKLGGDKRGSDGAVREADAG